MPIILIILIIAIVIIFVIAIAIKKNKQTEEPKNSKIKLDIPVKRTRLLTNVEASFYQALKEVIPPQKSITCKCRLEDIMSVENGPQRQSFRNRIKSRHIDFVIFTPESGYTDFAIELDDSSHQKKQDEDEFKNSLFQKIKMPLIRIKVQAKYNPDELKKIIDENTAK